MNNSIGGNNTATGAGALQSNIDGGSNTATGFQALQSNNTGISNTATGAGALQSNTGDYNTATGFAALESNTTGMQNTADGAGALASNTTAPFNTAVGVTALQSNTGGDNTAIGWGAGFSATTGDGNVYVGSTVFGLAGESNHTRIRNIGSTPIVGGTNVVVNGTGGIGEQVLGYASSSRRYKEDIQPMDQASETLFALKPVTFRAKKNMDPARVRYYGLIAEDVAEVDPDLVVYNPAGKPETLRFDSINAMLLNEFLKERGKVQQLEANAVRQQKQIEALGAGLQKVGAQLAAASPSHGGLKVSKFATGRIRRGGPAPQVVRNP